MSISARALARWIAGMRRQWSELMWLPIAGHKKKPFCFQRSVAMSRYCLLLLFLCYNGASPLQCLEDTEAGRLARIKALKNDILFKLQFHTTPNITHVHPISPSVLAEYKATIAAQAQVNKDLAPCAQYGRSSKELLVYFPAPSGMSS